MGRAVLLLPDTMADQDDLWGAGILLRLDKGPTDHGLDAENVEGVGGHERSVESDGAFGASDVDRSLVEGSEVLEGALPLLPIPIVVDGDLHRLDAFTRVGALQVHDALGPLERQSAVKGAVDDGEHHGREADSERQRHDGNDRRPRTLQQPAPRISEILDQPVHTTALPLKTDADRPEVDWLPYVETRRPVSLRFDSPNARARLRGAPTASYSAIRR